MERIGADAFIVHEGKFFMGLRKTTEGFYPSHWELPGGKGEGLETPHEALVREIQEELGVHVTVGEELYRYEYSYKGDHFTWHVYFATLSDKPSDIKQIVHDDQRWFSSQAELEGLQLTDKMRDAVTACVRALHR